MSLSDVSGTMVVVVELQPFIAVPVVVISSQGHSGDEELKLKVMLVSSNLRK